MADIDTAAIRAVYGAEFADGTVYDLCAEVDRLRARLAEVETARDKALNQARHWQEQEAKQRRLRHEEGRWKHRALQAELNASDLPGLRARLAEVEAEMSEERDHAAEGWERARHLQGLLQAAERGESKQIRRAAARGEGDPPAADHIGEGEYAEPPCEYTPRECPYGSDCPDHCPPRWDHPIRYPAATHNGEGDQ